MLANHDSQDVDSFSCFELQETVNPQSVVLHTVCQQWPHLTRAAQSFAIQGCIVLSTAHFCRVFSFLVTNDQTPTAQDFSLGFDQVGVA